jgi:hypothetical protein
MDFKHSVLKKKIGGVLGSEPHISYGLTSFSSS